jgi:hypothetical protein
MEFYPQNAFFVVLSYQTRGAFAPGDNPESASLPFAARPGVEVAGGAAHNSSLLHSNAVMNR